MVHFEIKVPPALSKWNLVLIYLEARKKHLLPAMRDSVNTTLQAVLRRMTVGATRHMVNSMRTQVVQNPGSTVGKVTTTIRGDASIFVMAAGGRIPGKKPPPSAELEGWVRFKGIGPAGQESRTAWVIARSIGKKGSRRGEGRLFQVRGLNASQATIEARHGQAVDAIIEEMNHGS